MIEEGQPTVQLPSGFEATLQGLTALGDACTLTTYSSIVMGSPHEDLGPITPLSWNAVEFWFHATGICFVHTNIILRN